MSKRPKHVTLDVTKQHIEEGVCGSASLCAVSLALKDVFPLSDVVVWEGDAMYVGRGNRPTRYTGVNKAEILRISRFIERFDTWHEGDRQPRITRPFELVKVSG